MVTPVVGAVASEGKIANPSVAEKMRQCLKNKKTRLRLLIVVLLVLVLVVGYLTKGWFVAATVNGSPISRLSVIQELEQQSGKQILDTLVTKKLIAGEIKKKNITVKTADIDAEIKKIELQVAGQGGTLDEALAQQGMTMDSLREQITIQKELEILLADKIAVSDDEVNEYLKANPTTPQQGMSSDDLKSQVREQLKSQKFATEAKAWLDGVKAAAKINYFVQY